MELELELEERDFPLYWPADYSQSAARNVKVLRASDFTGVERGEGGEGGAGPALVTETLPGKPLHTELALDFVLIASPSP